MTASAARDILWLPSIRQSGLAVLDGGFATHLEDVLHKDISSSPLWSASLLQSDDGHRAIVQTHLDFLEAGAQVISTSTYQASLLSFGQAGLDDHTSKGLLVQSIELAEQARRQYMHSHPEADRPLLSFSLGPYGAALSNGAEYTGAYHVPGDEQKAPTTEELEAFHYDRLEAVAVSPAWRHLDLLAFETLPRLDEASAIRKALARLYSHTACPRKAAYASFVFPDGQRLPYPHKDAHVKEDMIALIKATLGQGQGAAFDGIGINCTKPRFLSSLVRQMSDAVDSVAASLPPSRPYLFLYPDGGLVWDGIARVWKETRSGDGTEEHTWADEVLNAASQTTFVDKAVGSKATWAGCFVGGCCKSTADDIAILHARIDVRQRSASR